MNFNGNVNTPYQIRQLLKIVSNNRGTSYIDALKYFFTCLILYEQNASCDWLFQDPS